MEIRHPSLRLQFYLEQVPFSAGVLTMRWNTEPLADTQPTEGRVVEGGWGDLEQHLSGHNGDYEGSSLRITLNDEDEKLASLFAVEDTLFWVNRPAQLEILSVQKRKELDELIPIGQGWRPLITGRISDVQPSDTATGVGVTMTLRDLMAADFTSLDLDRPVVRRVLGNEHYGIAENLIGKPYPIIIGENSDEGLTDANGADASIGACPLIHCGPVMVNADGSFAAPGSETKLVIMQPPQNMRATIVNAGFTPPFPPFNKTYTYSVSAIVNGYGETRMSEPIVIENCPDELSAKLYIELKWDPPPEYGEFVNAYRVMGRNAFGVPTRHLKVLNNNGTFINPETTYNDTGIQPERLPIAPRVGTAQAWVLVDGVHAIGWGKMLVGLGAVRPTAYFGSDGGGPNGEAPRRIRLPFDHPDLISPYLEDGSVNPAWPLSDPWIEFWGDIRATYIGVKGTLLQHHIEGTVTMTANVCGWKPTGTNVGLMVNKPGQSLKMFLNEAILKNNGDGYRNGDFGPLETFDMMLDGPILSTVTVNNQPILRTSTFDAYDDLCDRRIPDHPEGGSGYRANWYINDENLSLRTFLQWFCQTFGCYIGTEDYGQIVLMGIDDQEPWQAAEHPQFREHIEIHDHTLPRAQLKYDWLQTKRSYRYHWIPASQRWGAEPPPIMDDEAAAKLKLPHREPTPVDCYCSGDQTTVDDAQARQLMLRKYPLLYQSLTTGVNGIEQRLGGIFRLSHSKGGGLGRYNNRPFFTMSRVYHPNNHEVTVTGFDISRLVGSGLQFEWLPSELYAYTVDIGTEFEDGNVFFSDVGVEFR